MSSTNIDGDTRWVGAWMLVLGNLYAGPLYAELVERHGLLRDEVAALIFVRVAGCVTAQDVVNFTGRPKNSIARAITSLESNGYLAREESTSDRRASTVQLTQAGAKLFKEIRTISARHDAHLLSALGKEDSELFAALIHRLIASYR
ncbi:MarR family winged helix-turn-helix transcriptional regulator [Tardiphaga sp. 619_E2_N8_5]